MSLNFISLAHAADAPAAQSGITTAILVLVMIVVFYFLIWRPQAKRNKETKAMLESLQVGSEVLTNGGIFGIITKISSDLDLVEIKISEGVEIKVKRGFIINVLPKDTLNSIK